MIQLLQNTSSLLLLFYLFQCFDCCQQRVEVANHKIFNIDTSNSSNCTAFSFVSCSERVIIMSEDQYYQQTYEYYSWDQCLDKFCSGMNNKPQTYKTLRECLQSNNTEISYQLTFQGKLGIGIGVPGAIIIYLLLCCFFKKDKNANNLNNNIPPRQQIYIEGAPIPRQDVSQQILVNQIDPQQIKNVICSICLSMNATARLECKHYSHVQCILDWSKKNLTCPQCRQKISSISIICKKCHNLLGMINISQSFNQLENCKDICSSCLNKQVIQAQIQN